MVANAGAISAVNIEIAAEVRRDRVGIADGFAILVIKVFIPCHAVVLEGENSDDEANKQDYENGEVFCF